MAINKVIFGGDTLIDLTADTVDAAHLLSGYTAHDKSGAQITGTNTYDSDTSEDTLAIAEALTGKTFHARGTGYTGTMPSSMSNVTVRHTVGYYGGLVLGITFEVTYSTGSGIDHYTYTYTVSGDSIIVVNIGSVSTTVLYYKEGSSTWTAASVTWKKISGVWTRQSDLTTVFDANTNYVKG